MSKWANCLNCGRRYVAGRTHLCKPDAAAPQPIERDHASNPAFWKCSECDEVGTTRFRGKWFCDGCKPEGHRAAAPVSPARENGLLPCPFCGTADHEIRIMADGTATIHCYECHFEMRHIHGASNVRFHWNRRAGMVPPPHLVRSEDTERLDWLEANATDIEQEINFEPDGRIILMQVEYDDPKRTLREAIDAARAAENLQSGKHEGVEQ